MKKKFFKISAIVIFVLGFLAGGAYFWLNRPSNSWKVKVEKPDGNVEYREPKNLSEIPAPDGFTRVPAKKGSYAEYLRTLPLKPKGSEVHLFDGSKSGSFSQRASAGVIDQDMFSQYEQCADVTMRLRAEYLWQHGRYEEIAFTTVDGKVLRYQGGASRVAFKKFMCQVYVSCNTTSLSGETKSRAFKDVQIGDIFNYVNGARSHSKNGHAILVVDVAVNEKGQKAVMCVEGLTPGCEKHVVRNLFSSNGAWFFIDDDADSMRIYSFHFDKDELRYYPHAI